MHVFYENDLISIEQSLGGRPNKGINYYISSMCDQNLFKELNNYNYFFNFYYCIDHSIDLQLS